MKKVLIKRIDNYDYWLFDNNKMYVKSIEFKTSYRPQVGDIIYLSKELLNEENIFSFCDKIKRKNIKENEIIKVISSDKEYYFIRQYG